MHPETSGAARRTGRLAVVPHLALLGALCLAVATVPAPARAAARSWKVDPGASTLVARLSPAGAFAFTQHQHFLHPQQWRGTARFDPEHPPATRVEVSVQADSLQDEQPALSAEDRREVEQLVRGPRVLDAGRFPRIVYTADRLEVSEQNGDSLRGTLVGTLSLHGQTWGLRVPVRVHWSGDTLVSEGDFTFLQSDFGMEPYRKLFGAISFEDGVEVRFRMVAHPEGGGTGPG